MGVSVTVTVTVTASVVSESEIVSVCICVCVCVCGEGGSGGSTCQHCQHNGATQDPRRGPSFFKKWILCAFYELTLRSVQVLLSQFSLFSERAYTVNHRPYQN